jgi:catechol 2,3-dioxygenase-like lactoylglutathione lyase family enzyme
VSTTELPSHGATAEGREDRHEARGRRHPVSDVDRARDFYRKLGWRLDVTKPGSGIDAAATTLSSASDLAGAMRRASVADGEHERRIGAADPNWPARYAAYMVAEQSGKKLPS